jgi:hypothetical protein
VERNLNIVSSIHLTQPRSTVEYLLAFPLMYAPFGETRFNYASIPNEVNSHLIGWQPVPVDKAVPEKIFQNLEDVPGTWVFLADFKFWTSQAVGFQKTHNLLTTEYFN